MANGMITGDWATAVQLHGGDRYRNHVKLDFSVNTNPLGMPEYVREALQKAVCGPADLWEWYPDPACGRLRESIASYHHIAKEWILCGNGASELITAAVRACAVYAAGYASKPGEERNVWQEVRSAPRIVLPVPSFTEYERTATASGAECVYHNLNRENGFALTETVLEKLTPDTDMLFLCNPNNPTGSLISEELLRRILKHCRKNNITVLLDECFLELCAPESGTLNFDMPEADAAERRFDAQPDKENTIDSATRAGKLASEYPNLIVLKAFTKLYAMPGMRLGYCICTDRTLRERIREQLSCWNVSGIAQFAGMTVLDSKKRIDYISQSKRMIQKERDWLTEELRMPGIKTVPGRANFICFHADPRFYDNLYETLLKKGILIRDCSGFRGMESGWYRIAVRPHEENEELIETIRRRMPV